MGEIRMVDLKGQYDKIKADVDQAIRKVLESTSFINGAEVKEFARNLESYLGVKHVIPCGNGTDALQVSLMSLDFKPGDEVITPDFTFVATVETIALLGLTPRLVDVDPDHFTIDIDALENAINKNTKAIIPVHLFGQCANMEEILKIANKYNLKVIEDTAQATGTTYHFNSGENKKAGTIGDIGCTSFFPSKNLGAYGDGGAIFTNNDELSEKLRYIVNHGMKTRYYHDYIGVNSRLDTIQAAILNVKLKYLDDYNKARQIAAEQYDSILSNHKNLITPAKVPWSDHTYHQYTLKTRGIDRDLLQKRMMDREVPAMIYYPVPIHKQRAYTRPDYKESDFEITNKLSESVISLPIHTELTDEQIQRITTTLIKVLNTL
jgi:dTDP-4-amino-4,6-dideoxygalactose transaminase